MKTGVEDFGCHVISVGPAAVASAEYLGEYRGWPVTVAHSMADAVRMMGTGLDGTVLVIADAGEETPRSFLSVATAGANGSPDLCLGFLYGRGKEQLLDAARQISDRPFVGDPRKQFLFVDNPDTWDFKATHLTLASEVAHDLEGLGDLVETDMDLAFFAGHGNGIDMNLGKVVLCRHSRTAPAAPDQLGVFPCYHGGPCVRTLGGARIRRAIEDVGARCLINLTCWGVSIAPAPYAPKHTLGEGFLRHSAVEAMVTTVGVAGYDAMDLGLLYFLCNDGLPLGQVANRANRVRPLDGRGAELLCFGDPRARIKPSLEKAEALRQGDKLTLRIPPSEHGPTDIRADISVEPLDDKIVLVDDPPSGRYLGGVLDPSGVMYASIAEGAGTEDVTLDIVGRSDLVERRNGARRVFQDLEFLDSYLPELLQSSDNRNAVVEVAEILAGVKAFLRSWPLDGLAAGSTVLRSFPDSVWDTLTKGLTALVESLMVLFEGFMTTRAGLRYDDWSGRYRSRRTTSDRIRCRYCGYHVDEWLLKSRMTHATRRIGYCHACGLIYDGDPAIGRWLVTEDILERGRPTTVRLNGRNPYGFPVPVAAVTVLERWELNESSVAKAGPFITDAGERCAVEAVLDVPKSFPPGVYHLSAAWMVGGRINFLRRDLRLRSEHTTEGDNLASPLRT
ncbi:hypothetical protein ACFL2Q_14240 [Thermodesulfobacteriota bacterium]